MRRAIPVAASVAALALALALALAVAPAAATACDGDAGAAPLPRPAPGEPVYLRTDGEVRALVHALKRATFSDRQVECLGDFLACGPMITSGQAGRIARAFTFSGPRLEAAKLMLPSVIDRGCLCALILALDYESDRDELRRFAGIAEDRTAPPAARSKGRGGRTVKPFRTLAAAAVAALAVGCTTSYSLYVSVAYDVEVAAPAGATVVTVRDEAGRVLVPGADGRFHGTYGGCAREERLLGVRVAGDRRPPYPESFTAVVRLGDGRSVEATEDAPPRGGPVTIEVDAP